MLLEYLFFEKEVKESIRKIENKDVDIKIKNIEESKYWIAKFSVKEKNIKEKNASILSDINKMIINDYGEKNITLGNDSASYYNQKLYPLVNSFERKLRKVVYMTIKLLSEDQERKEEELIENLERKNLGDIFDTLFTDENFNNALRKEINEGNKRHNKNEIINKIKEIKEETLWNQFLGKESAPTLQKKFNKLRNYRNSIMHAHNISKEDYEEIEELYLKVNDELNYLIKKIASRKIIKTYETTLNFSEALTKQLELLESTRSRIASANDQAFERMKEIQENYELIMSKELSASKQAFERMKEVQESFGLIASKAASISNQDE